MDEAKPKEFVTLWTPPDSWTEAQIFQKMFPDFSAEVIEQATSEYQTTKRNPVESIYPGRDDEAGYQKTVWIINRMKELSDG